MTAATPAEAHGGRVAGTVSVSRRRRRRTAMLRRPRRRRTARVGFSILELLVALALFLGIAFLTASVVDVQRRALGSTIGNARARRTAAQAVDVVVAQLRGAAAADLTLAADSAVELFLPIAEGVVCQEPAGPVVLLPPLGHAGDGARTRWRVMPDADDRALFLDPAGRTPAAWRGIRIAAAALRADPTLCPPSVGPDIGYTTADMSGEPRLELQLDALPAGVAAGTVVRVQRRLRLVLYRAADGSGQLGVRRCPADPAVPCAAVQPAVGPLLPPATLPSAAGLRFTYLDRAGNAVAPGDLASIALVHLSSSATPPTGDDTTTVEAWLALRAAR
ncbi:MAG: hypothetical protein ACYC2G_10280 [Gemmatimonadaceae bacterium]